MRHLTTRVCFAIWIFATVGSAVAEDDTKTAVKVFIDAATGKVRQPTPAEIENLAGATRVLTKDKQTGQPEQLDRRYAAGGAVGVRLGAESRSYVVVTRAPDGKLSMDCLSGEKAADKAVSGAK